MAYAVKATSGLLGKVTCGGGGQSHFLHCILAYLEFRMCETRGTKEWIMVFKKWIIISLHD
jgi:hypothetical protein